MNNPISIAEIKRRGMAAIEDRLRKGPVQIVKRNKIAAVVMSEEEYQRLIGSRVPVPAALTAVQWLLAQPASGKTTKVKIDARLKAERAW